MIPSRTLAGSGASPTGSWLALRQSCAVTRPTIAAASAIAPATRIKLTMPTRRLIDLSLPVLHIERDGFISFNGAERRALTAPGGDGGEYSRVGVLVERLVAFPRRPTPAAHGCGIEELPVHEMRRDQLGKS